MLALAQAYMVPRVRDVLALGGDAAEWERMFDEAQQYRWDEAVLRDIETAARQAEYERRLPYTPIASRARGRASRRFGNQASLAMLFRGLFQKDIGGVPGVSDSRFDADYYAVDGGSGKVSDFVDYIDPTHTLHQGTAANQVAVPAADAAMAGARTASFAGAQWCISSRGPSSFTYCHDGTGLSATCAWKPVSTTGFQVAWGTLGSTLSNGAMLEARGSTAVSADVYVGKTGGLVVNAPSCGVVAIGTPTYMQLDYAASAWAVRQKSAVVASGGATAPDTGAPLLTLSLGQRANGSERLNANWRCLFLYRRVLTSAQRAIVQSTIQATTGISP